MNGVIFLSFYYGYMPFFLLNVNVTFLATYYRAVAIKFGVCVYVHYAYG